MAASGRADHAPYSFGLDFDRAEVRRRFITTTVRDESQVTVYQESWSR